MVPGAVVRGWDVWEEAGGRGGVLQHLGRGVEATKHGLKKKSEQGQARQA